MTLDEAIAHAREVAKEKHAEAMLCHANPDDGKLDDCIECGKNHEQLADWLEELKAYQQQHIALCEKYDVNTVEELYVKAIDDFTKELKDYFIIPHDVKVIEMKAVQLKVVE